MLRQAVLAQQLLFEEHDVAADVWSATSYKLLRENALGIERKNRLNPDKPPEHSYIETSLNGSEGPVVAATDWIKAVPDQIARWVRGPYVSLGTDGFGRSDTRSNLRRHFEVDAEHIVVATLGALSQAGEVKPEAVLSAIDKYGLDPERPDPFLS